MTTNQYRHPAEADACTKENALGGDQGADNEQNETVPNLTVEQVPFEADVSRERGLYLPLAWAQLGREMKPQKFRGKHKRAARQAAINAKRMGGTIAAELAGLILLAAVAGVLLLGGA